MLLLQPWLAVTGETPVPSDGSAALPKTGTGCKLRSGKRKYGAHFHSGTGSFMSLDLFHPVIQRWFLGRFAAPTEPQRQGWPHIAAGAHTLIAAPTGSGKTLTAFLAAIDRLLKQ